MFDNLEALLDEVGLGLGHVLRTTVFLIDYSDFAEINEIDRAGIAWRV